MSEINENWNTYSTMMWYSPEGAYRKLRLHNGSSGYVLLRSSRKLVTLSLRSIVHAGLSEARLESRFAHCELPCSNTASDQKIKGFEMRGIRSL